jgi:hypothetical protein
MKTVWIYVNTGALPGDVDHVECTGPLTRRWKHQKHF